MVFTAIIPIKDKSQRLFNKNFRLLNQKPLFTYVLDTLCGVEEVREIVIDTDCPEKLSDYCQARSPRIRLLERPAQLLGDAVVMNQLLEHDLQYAAHEHIVQTHVTNPLLTAASIRQALHYYKDHLGTHDSLISVTRHQKRFYDQRGLPINHDLAQMQPTQDLPPVYEENSNLFVFSKQSFSANHCNRVGKTPFLFELGRLESIDIDYEEEFRLAELLLTARS